jgi:hypothetical protein
MTYLKTTENTRISTEMTQINASIMIRNTGAQRSRSNPTPLFIYSPILVMDLTKS